MFCMVTDGHVYTLNHQQKRLEKFEGEDEAEQGYKLQVGENYLIKEDAEANPARMIDSIEDILRILKEEDSKGASESKFIRLIHREDNLTDLLYQLSDVGYSPGINFEVGRITALKLGSLTNGSFCWKPSS